MVQPPFSFLTATEIRFGRGVSGGAAEALASKSQKIMVVHGATSARAEPLIAALRARGLEVTPFCCPREPDIELVEAGSALARTHKVGAVAAMGGGAVIDAGKAIAALAPSQRPLLDHLEIVGRGLPLDAPPLPFIALPTTAGTGAEVTKNAVIGVPQARRKVSLRDNRMLPVLALIDPALTDHCPRAITLASGLDAITQVIEPYVSAKANRLTDALCRDAIASGLAALMRLMEMGDAQARDDMAWVSLCGGLALANAGLGAVHGLAGPIGGLTPAPHGAICGALLPHVLKANLVQARQESGTSDACDRLQEVCGWIAAALGCMPEDAPERLAEWAAAQGLPRLGALGLTRSLAHDTAVAAKDSSSMRGNPVTLPDNVLLDILLRAM